MAQSVLSYADVQQALTQSHSLADAAEAHGTLSGALCAATGYHLDDWLGEILPDGRPTPEAAAWLRAVYDSTSSALGDTDLGFQPLLPTDDDALSARTEALGEWCRGFLYGLGTGPAGNLDSLGEETGEIIRDFTAITQVGVDPDDGDESNEEAYAELVEFVRVAVQMLFERLEPLRAPPTTERQSLH
ncbi:YecA family protein [bacterium]|nr:MAG: YecA family protein [bacterium]